MNHKHESNTVIFVSIRLQLLLVQLIPTSSSNSTNRFRLTAVVFQCFPVCSALQVLSFFFWVNPSSESRLPCLAYSDLHRSPPVNSEIRSHCGTALLVLRCETYSSNNRARLVFEKRNVLPCSRGLCVPLASNKYE